MKIFISDLSYHSKIRLPTLSRINALSVMFDFDCLKPTILTISKSLISGLKKVTSDMQTHKNPELRGKGAPEPKAKSPPKPAAKPVATVSNR